MLHVLFHCVGSDLMDVKIIPGFLVARSVAMPAGDKWELQSMEHIWDPGVKQHVGGIGASVCLAQ